MIWARNCTLVLGKPDDDGDRPYKIWIEAENNGATYEDTEVSLILRDSAGAVIGTDSTEGEALPPGIHLLQYQTWFIGQTLIPQMAECTLIVKRRRGLAPVRLSATPAPPRLVPVPPVDEPAAPAASQPATPPAAAEPTATEPTATEPTDEQTEEAPLPAPTLVPDPPAPSPAPAPPIDPWQALRDGDLDPARAAFQAQGLDSAGRDRVRRMLRSVAADDLAEACQIAAWTGWRSAAMDMRRLTRHGVANVRAEAARALGVLSGPSLIPYVEPLLNDRDEGVRQAATEAVMRMQVGG